MLLVKWKIKEKKSNRQRLEPDPWEGSATTPSKKPAPKPQATSTDYTCTKDAPEPQQAWRLQFRVVAL
jgi:hypothetical protein